MAEDKVSIDLPEGDHSLFNATREGLPEVLSVNGPLRDFAHKDIFPWHLSVLIEAEEVTDNGLPTAKENQVLYEIGDEIQSVVVSGKTAHGSPNVLFLARSSWKECRELLYMVHDPEITNSALQALLGSRDWQRAWDYEMEHDPQWRKASLLLKLSSPIRPVET